MDHLVSIKRLSIKLFQKIKIKKITLSKILEFETKILQIDYSFRNVAIFIQIQSTL